MYSLYEEIKGSKFPVQLRETGSVKTDPCIFCGREHEHSPGEGHRHAHCKTSSDGTLPRGIELDDGTFAEQRRGYILRYRD